MAAIDASNQTHHLPRGLEGPTCCGAVGTLTASLAALTAAFGESDYHGLFGWVVRYPGDRMAIMQADDERGPTDANTPCMWWVIGYHRTAVEAVRSALGLSPDDVAVLCDTRPAPTACQLCGAANAFPYCTASCADVVELGRRAS
jgi:hypothetical protein